MEGGPYYLWLGLRVAFDLYFLTRDFRNESDKG